MKSERLLDSAEFDGRDYFKVSGRGAKSKVQPFSEQDRNVLLLHLTRAKVEQRIGDERVSVWTVD